MGGFLVSLRPVADVLRTPPAHQEMTMARCQRPDCIGSTAFTGYDLQTQKIAYFKCDTCGHVEGQPRRKAPKRRRIGRRGRSSGRR